MGGKKSDEFYKNYAKLLFTQPEQGLETLNRISQLTSALRGAREAGETVGGFAGTAAGRETAAGLDVVQEQAKIKRGEMLGAGAIATTAVSPELDNVFRQIQEFEPNSPTNAPQQTLKIGKQDISIPQGKGFAPPDLVKAVMTVESSGNPKARSNKGAYGLMQLMPGTAKELGVDPKDPQQNVEGGSRYLAKQLTEFDDVRLALAAYNWGPGALSNAIKKLKAEDRPVTWENLKKYGSVPTETENYVKKVLNIMNA